jgi:1,2-diacylglycerol 3-alpha-glucosyltransferase
LGKKLKANNMRIAMFSDNFYPELSGISDSIMTTGRELAQRGHEIAYYAPRYSRSDFAAMHLPDIDTIGPRTSIHRLPAVRYKAGTGTTQAALPLFTTLPSLTRFKPDIIHTHHIFGAGLEGVFESKLLRVPLVETNHTPLGEFLQYSPWQADWWTNFAFHYDSWMYNQADFVSSPTRLIFDSLKYADPRVPHHAVSNPVDTDKFRPEETGGARAVVVNKKHPFTILYAGRLAKEKKIDIVLRAAAMARKAIPDIRVIIVGRGAYEKPLRELVAQLGMEQAVTFTGFVPDDHLPAYYAQSDVFAIMSTAETQSIVAMQAFACNIPVIAADAWGFKEYIIPEAGFLIKPGDVDAVAEKFVYLYKNPAVRAKMGMAGRKHVEQFSIANIATLWEGIYKDVATRYNKKA